MTGKLADTVMSVRNGEQIARKYQPVVFNPSTPAQVAQRAKLKLLSQLSAVMAPVIAIPSQGPVSSRNLFTKKNFPFVTYNNSTASAILTSVQLTDSVVALPNLAVVRDGTNLTALLQGTSGPGIDRVVYCLFTKQVDETLRFTSSKVVTDAGATNNFETNFVLDNVDTVVVVYAYGIRDNSEAAKATFGNLTVPTAESVANLIVTRSLTSSDVTLTETRALESAPATTNNSNRKR